MKFLFETIQNLADIYAPISIDFQNREISYVQKSFIPVGKITKKQSEGVPFC